MAKKKGLDFTRKKKIKFNSAIIREIFSWSFWIAISAVTAFVLMYVFGLRTNVVGNSMETSLYSGQQILIDRMIYNLSSPKRGDVVAFIPNGNEKSHYYIKRVVGIPGETLQIIDGYLYVNGKILDEGGKYDKIADPGILDNPMVLGDDEYFVLGDNRNFSEDSRSGNIGAVKQSYMIGKAWFKLSKQLEFIGFIK